MKLICPACGATASIETWENDPIIRAALVLIADLPSPVNASAVGYLSLFRPAQRALGWKRVRALLAEIKDLTASGYVHIHGKPDKDCSASVYARAMDQMALMTTIKRPLKGHNYLCQVAWDLAETVAKAHEKQVEVERQSGDRHGIAGMTAGDLTPAEISKLSPALKKKMGVE